LWQEFSQAALLIFFSVRWRTEVKKQTKPAVAVHSSGMLTSPKNEPESGSKKSPETLWRAKRMLMGRKLTKQASPGPQSHRAQTGNSNGA
jgi:hypothetical protein